MNDIRTIRAELIRAKKRIRKLEKALRFYADPDTYFAIAFLPDPPCGDFIRDGSEINGRMEPGKRARRALGQV